MSSDDEASNSAPERENGGKALVSFNVSNLLNLKPIGKLGLRILDAAFGGTARLYEDRTVVSRAKSEATATLIRAEAEAEAAAIREVTLAKARAVAAAIDPATIQGRAALRLEYEAVRQQENIEQVVRNAVEYADQQEANGKVDASEDAPPVDEGWFFQFSDICKNATKEEMQRLLGKVLAQEVAQPGKFSIRSVLTLTTISASEAEAFRRVCQLNVIPFDMVMTSRDWLDGSKDFFGVKFRDIILCRSGGLLVAGDNVSRALSIETTPKAFGYGNLHIVVRADAPVRLKAEIMPFTAVGSELASIIDVEPNPAFLSEFVRHLEGQGVHVLNRGDLPIAG